MARDRRQVVLVVVGIGVLSLAPLAQRLEIGVTHDRPPGVGRVGAAGVVAGRRGAVVDEPERMTDLVGDGESDVGRVQLLELREDEHRSVEREARHAEPADLGDAATGVGAEEGGHGGVLGDERRGAVPVVGATVADQGLVARRLGGDVDVEGRVGLGHLLPHGLDVLPFGRGEGAEVRVQAVALVGALRQPARVPPGARDRPAVEVEVDHVVRRGPAVQREGLVERSGRRRQRHARRGGRARRRVDEVDVTVDVGPRRRVRVEEVAQFGGAPPVGGRRLVEPAPQQCHGPGTVFRVRQQGPPGAGFRAPAAVASWRLATSATSATSAVSQPAAQRPCHFGELVRTTHHRSSRSGPGAALSARWLKPKRSRRRCSALSVHGWSWRSRVCRSRGSPTMWGHYDEEVRGGCQPDRRAHRCRGQRDRLPARPRSPAPRRYPAGARAVRRGRRRPRRRHWSGQPDGPSGRRLPPSLGGDGLEPRPARRGVRRDLSRADAGDARG